LCSNFLWLKKTILPGCRNTRWSKTLTYHKYMEPFHPHHLCRQTMSVFDKTLHGGQTGGQTNNHGIEPNFQWPIGPWNIYVLYISAY
jgi:hypothetical protein